MIKIDFNVLFDDEVPQKDIPIEYNDVLYGDILIRVNDSVYSHKETVVCNWMNNLIRTIIHLKCSSDYVIKEPENYWDHIKFEKKGPKLSITYLSDDKEIWNEEIDYSDFEREVVNTANELIERLCDLDIRFRSSKVVMTFDDLLNQISLNRPTYPSP